jgi:hypothetical protein
MERCFNTLDDQGVSSIVSALKANRALGGLGQPVHQFALAFVTPLSADDHNISSWGAFHKNKNLTTLKLKKTSIILQKIKAMNPLETTRNQLDLRTQQRA